MFAVALTYTRGRRVWLPAEPPSLLPGEYARGPDGWWLRPPAGPALLLRGHWVSEHRDGSISVRRELWTAGWRGHLERGTWAGREW